MKTNIKIFLSGFALLATISMTSAMAHPSESGKRHGPPEEAVAACEGYIEGDAVSFEAPNGENLEATCKKVAGVLAAVPNDHGKRPRKTCADKSKE
ncbi:MAG TPA: hypothetical protein VIM93_09565 [Kangiella sp.]